MFSSNNAIFRILLTSIFFISIAVRVEAGFRENLKIVQQARVTCREGDTCSPSAGLLAFVELGNQYGACTATLVAPDVIATNGHCVPKDLQRADADCRGRLMMVFAPKKGHPEYEARAACESVIYVENPPGDDFPDFAFLKISRVRARPFLQVTREGINDQEIFHVDRSEKSSKPNSIVGIISTTTCRAYQNSLFAETFTSSDYPTAFLSDCRIVHGNSGAALRDAKGNVRGVIYALVEPKGKQEVRVRLAAEGEQLPKNLPDLSFATNFACLTLPAELAAGAPPATCDEKVTPNASRAKLEQMTHAFASDALMIARAEGPAYRWFDWALTREKNHLLYEPKCVNGSQAKYEIKAATGLGPMKLEATLDQYGRYQDSRVVPVPSPPQQALVSLPELGYYKVQAGAKSYTLRGCR